MATLLNWKRSKTAQQARASAHRLRIDVNSVTLAAGQDPRGMILAFFRHRWRGQVSWPFHQRIIIDRITVDGAEWNAK